MDSLEVLIAAMNQTDERLYYQMGLETNAVIANQTNGHWVQEYCIDGNMVKLLSTKDRGVGKNRNLAIMNASADLCLVGDDDLVYKPDYQETIKRAFEKLPDADLIVFNVTDLKSSDRRVITKAKKVRIFNFARHGAPKIAFRRKSLLKANLWFSLLFGGGAMYSSGEDSIFLREALRKGLKVYTYPGTIAEAKQERSTWFTGYNEKFFFDKGALIAGLFPRLKCPAGIYIALRFKRQSEFSYPQALKYVFAGIKALRKGVSYAEWKETAAHCQ